MALRQRAMPNGNTSISSLATHRDPETVVALDAIASWIGRTEKRLAALVSDKQKAPIALAKALAAISSHVQALHHKVSTLPGASACTVAAITDMSLEIERLHVSIAQRATREELSTLNENIRHSEVLVSRLSHALSALEGRLSIIEQQTAKRDESPLALQLPMLIRLLDNQMRVAADRATSTARCFELMADKIEVFSRDIRRLRKERADTAAVIRLLPALLEKLEQHPERHNDDDTELSAAKIDLITEQLDQLRTETTTLQEEKSALSSELKLLKGILEQTLPPVGKQHSTFPSVANQLSAAVQSLESSDQSHRTIASVRDIPDNVETPEQDRNQISDTPVDPASLRIRADFIAAARLATRSGHADTQARQTEAIQPITTRRFLRMSAKDEL